MTEADKTELGRTISEVVAAQLDNESITHERLNALFGDVLRHFHHCNMPPDTPADELDWLIINQNLMGNEGPSYAYEETPTPALGMNLGARIDLLRSLHIEGVGFPTLTACRGWDADGSYYTPGFGIDHKIYADEETCLRMSEQLRSIQGRRVGIAGPRGFPGPTGMMGKNGEDGVCQCQGVVV